MQTQKAQKAHSLLWNLNPQRFRFRLRIKKFGIQLVVFLSKTQTLEGCTSKVLTEPKEKHVHFIFWDLEGCTLQQAIDTLRIVQVAYRLGDIIIVSDKEGSYRAWCYSKRPFLTYLRILIDTQYVDYGFFVWTVKRGAATLRTSQKIGREPQEQVAYLHGYESTMVPQRITRVVYDSGIVKSGINVNLGEQ
jgi:hypothetical protein